jgi:hypothetical protein
VQPPGEAKPGHGHDICRRHTRYRPDSRDQYGTDERTSAGRSDHGGHPHGERQTLMTAGRWFSAPGRLSSSTTGPWSQPAPHRPDSDTGAETVGPAAMTPGTGG